MKRLFLLTSVNFYIKRQYSNVTNKKSTVETIILENSRSAMNISALTQTAVGFRVDANQIQIIQHPSEFYDILIDKCRSANRRIVLASLYFGTGGKESHIVSAIQKRLAEKSDMSVKILLDCTRGSRGKTNSRTMLLPLIQQHPNNCEVSLYHTPKLRGLLRLLLPHRYNEVVGLQHMKFYLFDDDLIISGANLSDDYFTHRQDRYMVVSNCRPLANFIEDLTVRVSDFSFKLTKNDELFMQWPHHPVNSKLKDFVNSARSHVWEFYYKHVTPHNIHGEGDTVIYPLLEMGQLDLHQDSIVTQNLLNSCPADACARLATGYFNITQGYADSIVEGSRAQFTVLMAHPKANGFYKAKGPAGGIPKGYSELAGRFYDQIYKAGQEKRIALLEYIKEGWTFHAKGLWLSPSIEAPPCLTLIGSPNFGERSVHKDLECQFLIVSSNSVLQRLFQDEADNLFQLGKVFGEEERSRKPPLWVKIVLFLFKKFL